VARAFARFSERCSAHGVRVFVHEASLRDVARDKDAARRRITESKIGKFEILRDVPTPDSVELEKRFGRISKHNDLIDCTLLHALAEGVVEFLVTQDDGLQKRAAVSGLGGRVFTVEEAVEWLRQTYEPKCVVLPDIAERYCYQIPKADPIFDTLRADYDEFDEWFRKKCVETHRKCWMLSVGEDTAGIVIWKDEGRSHTTATLPGEKIFKICTFKVSEQYLGEKFGELLLKQALWFAQRNRYDVAYLTAYAHHGTLIALLEQYGFRHLLSFKGGHGEERQYEKALGAGPIVEPGDPIALDREHYPRFVDDGRVRILCVPIRPAYHRLLFPEKFEPVHPTLFGLHGAAKKPGNTIRKVYLCRSAIRKMSPGDVLLFYMSKDEEYLHSRSLTSVGVVTDVSETGDMNELALLTAKRSVFSDEALRAMLVARGSPLKVINFLLVGHFDAPVPWSELKRLGVLKSPPQSIVEIATEAYGKLDVYGRLGL
jgi:ribosomal protein S18 acetylase RimI-like enzyme